MQRPTIRPRENWFKNTDEQLVGLLDKGIEEALNIKNWTFPVNNYGDEVTYGVFSDNIRGVNIPPTEWIEAMRYAFLVLIPEHHKRLVSNMKAVLYNYLLNHQERLNHITELNQYCDYLEEQISLGKTNDEKRLSRIEAQIAELVERLADLQQQRMVMEAMPELEPIPEPEIEMSMGEPAFIKVDTSVAKPEHEQEIDFLSPKVEKQNKPERDFV